jgi:soluble lytic murein transglycosylase-like protein
MAEMDFTKVKLSKEQIGNANMIVDKANEYGIDPDLALALAWKENHFKMGADSPKGAIGIMQVMPSNAEGLGLEKDALRDPATNVDAGMRILKENLDRYKNPRAALVAYNAGPPTADKYVKADENFDTLKSETKNYLEDIHKVYSLHPDEHPPEGVKEAKNEDFAPVEDLPEHLKNYTPTTQEEPSAAGVAGQRLKEFAVENPSTAGFASGLLMGDVADRASKGWNKFNENKTPPPPPPGGPSSSSRAREVGFNLETQRRAEQARANQQMIEEIKNRGLALQESPVLKMGPMDVTNSGILVPGGSGGGGGGGEPPPKETPRKSPLDGFIDRITKQAPQLIKAFPRASGALSGLLAGHEAGQARESLEQGDPLGAILSGTQAGLGATSMLPIIPPQIRAGAMGLQIPLSLAKQAWESYREPSAVKRELKKNPELNKAKGGKVNKPDFAIPLSLKHVYYHRKSRNKN